MIITGGKQVVAIMRGNKVVQAVYHGAILVWQAIRALFFTKDGFYIETKDGKIFDMKQ